MFQNIQIPYLWDHSVIGDVFTISFDCNRQFLVSISTQVLKLASRFANQNSKEEISCLLIGSCDNSVNRIKIDIDRIECNLASYMCDNQMLCTNDICIPLKIYKNKSEGVYLDMDYSTSLNELIKGFEDISLSLLISKLIVLKAYAGFNSEVSKNKNQLQTMNWIDLKLLILDFNLILSPIKPMPIFRSALISSFENHSFTSQFDNTFTFGYLSIDQPGKVHFLLHSDERANTASLIGIWVHGVSDVSDILVVGACLKYILIKSKHNKIAKPPFLFLLAEFTSRTKNAIRFYDVKWPKGPFADEECSLKHINFKLFSAVDNLDRYYQHPNEKVNLFAITLSPVNINSRPYESIAKAIKLFTSQNNTSNEIDETVPRPRSTVPSIMSNEYQNLEVSDISLLVNDVSVTSNTSCRSLTTNHEPYSGHSISPSYPQDTKSSTKHISENILTSSQNDEAIPRPLLRKQHIVPSSPSQVLVHGSSEPHYNQLQFVPQPMFPYPALYPANPYMMMPPNMYMYGQEQNIPIVSKPPLKPKKTESTNKKIRVLSNKNDDNNNNNNNLKQKSEEKFSKVISKTVNFRVDRAVITDVTNTTPKRVLQLDREEDLATLELLVQQIINQRPQGKPTMISIGVNTNEMIIDKPSPKTIEVSTDVPSFIVSPLCARCKQLLTDNNRNSGIIENRSAEPQQFDISNDKENSFESTDFQIFDKPDEVLVDFQVDGDEQKWFDKPEESMHYSELLSNLDQFVKQSRGITADKQACDISKSMLSNEDEETKRNILEEAVQNLRELDVTHDYENQYWEMIRNTETVAVDNRCINTSISEGRDNLDVTILQQKINYVSLFLNNSPQSYGSIDSRSSLNEQSIFIDSLARKYLHKATSELEKIGQNSATSSKYLPNGTNYNDISVSTLDYLRKFNLIDDDDKQSDDIYYSSIRLPDGRPLPVKRWAISSTPAPNHAEISLGCKKVKPSNNVIEDGNNWSGVRILEGLTQQPSILPPSLTKEFIDYSSQRECVSSAVSSDMVLDLDKLRLLPKYL